MAKEVKIPVKVTGSEKAQSDLKKTGAAVKDVGSAGARAATGTRQATSATKAHTKAQTKAAPAVKKTTKAVDQFDDSAKTALTGIIGQFNPMLASLGNIAVDVAKGITKMSGALVGMLGAGIAVAAIVMVFQKIRDAAREARDAVLGYAEARAELRKGERSTVAVMMDTLRKYNLATSENEQRVKTMYERIRKQGFKPAVAQAIAPYAIAEGATAKEAGLAAQLSTMGFKFEKPGAIKDTLATLRKESPGFLAAAEEQRRAFQETVTGKAETSAGRYEFPKGKMAETPEERALEALQRRRVVGGETNLAEFEERVERLEGLRGGLEKFRKNPPRSGALYMEELSSWWRPGGRVRKRELEKTYRKEMGPTILAAVEEERRLQERQPDFGVALDEAFSVSEQSREAASRAAQAPQIIQNITNNNVTVNQGVVLDTHGVMARPETLTPEIIERGAYGP